MRQSFHELNERLLNAESAFLENLVKLGGISPDGARKVLTVFRYHKVVKEDANIGRISVTHGAYLDRENILEAFRHAIEENSTCRYCRKGVRHGKN